MLEYLKSKRIMLVVAHPDDEILGLGATFHKLINEFDALVHVVILGEGLTSRSDVRDVNHWKNDLSKHRENIKQAHKAIGYQSSSIYDFPDNRFDSVHLLDLIKVVEKEKEFFKPEIIFTHHGGDVNIDHQRTFEAVITATRPLENENVKSIFTFETPSGTEWRSNSDPKYYLPNVFVKVEKKDIDAKITAMESYEFEKRNYPHPRSPIALSIYAQRWGITVGVEYAETFCLIRNISFK